ncbi:MAG: IS200/IS605 family transposase [Bacteroidales bacterium]|nr:IS200/IS605 family transposase [Bacteroidales bacterium]
MLHTHSKIWVHLVWTTKCRNQCLFGDAGRSLFQHLIDHACKEIKIPFEVINIQPEHIHALIDLPTNIALADFMQLVKGESSHWMNNQKLLDERFSWQRGFGAYSVSASQLEIVKKYIKNQLEHHKKHSFSEEYEKWKKEYGIFDD